LERKRHQQHQIWQIRVKGLQQRRVQGLHRHCF
jgi:hypothetical protein